MKPLTLKSCRTCGQEKDASQFYRMSSGYQGRVLECRECRRDFERAAQYGMTVSEMRCFIEKANGRCAICGVDNEKLNIDHCHNSNRVRGMLCTRCNTRLGVFDDHEWLKQAAEYLGAVIIVPKHDPVEIKRPARGRAPMRGGAHPRASLSSDDVMEILNAVAKKEATHAQLAERFGVARHTITAICNGRAWAHITRPYLAANGRAV